MMSTAGSVGGNTSRSLRTSAFTAGLPPEERVEFESLRTSSDYPSETTLFVEQQPPDIVLFVFAGQVKLSLNSSGGRRVILGIACPGETLGLASAFSRTRYDITAETVSPCTIGSITTENLLEFLRRHPSAYVEVARQLCVERSRACEQVRRLGLAVTASARLVRFLLDQCAVARQANGSTRLFCSFTHEEIGECIGVSRETVTRIFCDFRSRELLESRGSTLIISDGNALEAYAGIE